MFGITTTRSKLDLVLITSTYAFPMSSCTQIIEHADVPGQGSFSAYEDGRVRVMFQDRTILHLNAPQSHCKVRVMCEECTILNAT